MKRGISLIAVLMFMLAATAASIVLFKWIGSENFLSSARLKHSEAYQASESGLDAAQAWLSYKAADVGLVLSEHLKSSSKRAYLLNHPNNDVLGISGNDKQNFRVYLIGADTASKPYKLKFMSIGKGRDNSEVMQTAIFNVDGLYSINVPIAMTPREPSRTDFDEDFWGNLGTVGVLESMRAVITQSPAILDGSGHNLNSIKIGTESEKGYLVLDGNYYTNSISIYGDVYSTGMFDFCPSGGEHFIAGNLYVRGEFHPKGALRIDGDAFLNGGVDPNANINDANNASGGCIGGATGGVVQIGKNSTISANFVYYNNQGGGGLGFSVLGNLVMDKGDILLERKNNNNTNSFSGGGFGNSLPQSDGNVYIAGSLIGPVPDNSLSPVFGKEPSSVVCIQNMTYSTGSSPKIYTNSSNIQMKTYADQVYNNLTSPQCVNWQSWGADPLDNLKAKLEQGNGTLSCENTPIKFDTTIYVDAKKANPPNWVHRADRPGNCATQEKCEWDAGARQMVCINTLKLENQWVNLDAELKDCWDRSANELRDGWLVVYLKDYHFQLNGTSLGNGKYIIILEDLGGQAAAGPNDYLYLPPTGDAEVMLYLPKGWPNSNIALGGGSGIDSDGDGFYDDKYNYFIFSDGNIKQFNTTAQRKLSGSIFMNKCSIMNTNATNPYLMSKSNRPLIDSLMARGILQEMDWTSTGNPPPGGYEPPSLKADDYIIPLSPRLKVELESKYISKESKPSSYYPAEKFVLAMPRVLRLPKQDFVLGDYYKLLYLNGAEPPGQQTDPLCTNTSSGLEINFSDPVIGVYICSFTGNPSISDFYIKIENSAPLSEDGSEPHNPAEISSSSSASSSSSSLSSANLSSSSVARSSSSRSNIIPPNCAFLQPWCPDIPYGEVITSPNGFNTNWIDFGGPVCIFTEEIEAIGNNAPYTPTPATSIKVNGKVLPNNNEGRCGGFLYSTDDTWRANQLSCANAISQGQVSKADGGYYIYITKEVGQPFRITGGSPDCDANSSGSNTQSSNSIPPSSSSVPPSSSSNQSNCPDRPINPVPNNYNEQCMKYNGNCYKCNNNHHDCDKSWLWSGAWDNAWLNNGAQLVQIDCPSTTPSSSSVALSATCTLMDRNNQPTQNLTVRQGENIRSPEIICSSGNLTKNNNTVFKSPNSGHVPSNWSNWNNNSNAYYTGSQSPGDYQIAVSDFYCDGNRFYNDRICGTITVVRPTCSGVSGTVGINETITPTVNCGAATPGNRTFNVTGGNGINWENNSNTGGKFTSLSGSSSNQTIYLNTVSCDNNITLAANTVSCGSVTLTSSNQSNCPDRPINPVPNNYNEQCMKYNGNCYKCNNNHHDCDKSWLWSGAWDNAWLNNGAQLVQINCPGAAQSTCNESTSGSQKNFTNNNATGAFSINTGDCIKIASCSTKLHFENNSGGTQATLELTGGCTINYTLQANSEWNIPNCPSNTGPVYIKVTGGSTTRFNVGCWN